MTLKTSKNIAIGADIGGSHISCAAVDMNQHFILPESYTVKEVDNKGSAEEIINKWCDAISQTLSKIAVNEPVGIGLAMPGPFDYINGIGLFKGVEKFENLYGVNVAEKIKLTLSFKNDIPVRFMNDATSFAIGAVWADDNLAGKNVLAITLGTGFGSAFIMNSLPVFKDKMVPELGFVYHLPYKEGIADDTFSTRGMIRAYLDRTGIALKGVKEIANLASSDKHAADTFNQFGEELADFLSSWISEASITNIIMGGNISKAYELFKDTFEAELRKSGSDVVVQISDMNDQMAILGSARLSDKNYWERVKSLLKDI